MINYKALQNGSDIRGVALPGIVGETVNLTEEAVKTLALSFASFLCEKTGKAAKDIIISVGHDSRLTANTLKTAAISGLISSGVSVYDCALASTPSIFMSTVLPDFNCDGGIMLTASHLPFNRNGMKFFTKDGGLEKGDISTLVSLATENNFSKCDEGQVIQKDLISSYSNYLVCKIRDEIGSGDKPLDGFKIIVDAGNGAGGFFALKILTPLGADTTGSVFLDPDGNFPNHIPNPEDKEAMKAVCKATLAADADLGIIFDTDVDRASVVDKDGNEINKNTLIALLGAILKETDPGTTIVTDSVTSDELTQFLADEGLIHHRFKRGYKNVINESIRLNNEGQHSALAVETSGHGAFKENYFLDDGAYIAAKILIKLAKLRSEGKTLSSMLQNLKQPADTAELRFKISQDDFKTYGEDVIEKLKAYAISNPNLTPAEKDFEGVRVNTENGWFLLRLSLHDPLMPLNIESKKEGGCKEIAKVIYEFLRNFDMLDLAPIEKYIG